MELCTYLVDLVFSEDKPLYIGFGNYCWNYVLTFHCNAPHNYVRSSGVLSHCLLIICKFVFFIAVTLYCELIDTQELRSVIDRTE